MFANSATLEASLEGKPFRVILSGAAQRALAVRTAPLIAEMELYFSCLTRLMVRFYDSDPDASATRINERLSVRFRPVVSQRCDLHEVEGKPPLMDAPLTRRAPFVPHWLKLDYRRGRWFGEFGHTKAPKKGMPGVRRLGC